ncbi:Fic family protein [Schleiferilactobacillus harbinensis]|uniref:Fic family protein n=1 Tax=Schleiferilactobacillus harbinensis TaxID=304207 RepID=UPI0009E57511|nr:Fic family protein [Schleiferilactobacillus harbinensis]
MAADKFAMSRDGEDILVEKNFAQLVYLAGKFAGLSTTLLDTQAKPSEIRTILNLRDAYHYAMSLQYISEVSFAALLKINLFVIGAGASGAGQIRVQPVVVPLTDMIYQPTIPDETQVKREFSDLVQSEATTTDKAITLLLWLSRVQLFLDGNKRTAIIAANALMFAGRRGLLAVPENKLAEYLQRLQQYYKNGDTAIFGF